MIIERISHETAREFYNDVGYRVSVNSGQYLAWTNHDDNGNTIVVAAVCARKLSWAIGEVRHLFVRPENRRQRLASDLIQAAEAHLKQKNVPIVFTTIREDNAASKRLFFLHGYDNASYRSYRNYIFESPISGDDVGFYVKLNLTGEE